MAKCPVCGMDVDTLNPQAVSSYNGETYLFCCEECQQKFERNPEQYLRRK